VPVLACESGNLPWFYHGKEEKGMPPIVSIVGKSETGKTTLIQKLIKELKSRGYRIATIKHTPQEATFDQPNKDSWRHIQAGSEATIISATDRIAMIKPVAQALTVDQVARYLGEDYDLIIAEGFKESSIPKIEVHRKEIGPPLGAIRKRIAIVTDEPLTIKARQFSTEDVNGLASFLEEGFIKPQQRRVLLYVNNKPVTLTTFPRQVIRNILLGIAASLKGVGKVKNLNIFLREEPD
jgi:molybdopterin-guanine dinucleotide biosynthesis protein B